MNQKPVYEIRPLTVEDQPLLWEMLYLTLHVADGYPPFGRHILDEPEIARYATGWGRSGDVGFVAMAGDEAIGASWMRLFTSDEPGYAYVDAFTPELGMAVTTEYRGHGIGSGLLKALLDEAGKSFKQMSLSVSKQNPAINLYRRFGFEVVGTEGMTVTMLKRLTN